MMRDVAALFVDPRGPYRDLPGIDLWHERRDARHYTGPYPVVAHPPCNLWTNFARLNFKRYGGKRNIPGNDRGCFASALASVRRWGGVLEHPAFTHAWAAHDLPPPTGEGWQLIALGQWVAEIYQSAYGHPAQKRTWLFYSGSTPPLEGNWARSPGTHQCGWFDRKKPTLGKREASRTPTAFAQYLVALARHSRKQ